LRVGFNRGFDEAQIGVEDWTPRGLNAGIVGFLVRCSIGTLPGSLFQTILATDEETKGRLWVVGMALNADRCLLNGLSDLVWDCSSRILSFSSDQIVPLQQPFGGQYFDDFAFPTGIISACTPGGWGNVLSFTPHTAWRSVVRPSEFRSLSMGPWFES
jgi:hypothetical protein